MYPSVVQQYMEIIAKVTSLMVLCMVVVAPHAEAMICGAVAGYMMPCLSYLEGIGPLMAGCCNGVRGLNKAAKTTPERQDACYCLVAAAKAMSNIDYDKASKLPGQCGVNLPYKINPNIDCKKVK